MSPTVRDGEHLIVAPVGAAQVQVGDVVFCQMVRGPIAHRVWAVNPQSDGSRRFILAGDASWESDRPVAAAQLRGQVVAVDRGGTPVSLRIGGGRIGRAAFMTALRLRRAISIARGRLTAPLIPAVAPR
jgi:hypothetical protein